MASGNIPIQAGVSPDRHQVSNALGGGTIVTLYRVPQGAVLITAGSSVSHLSWMALFLPATFPLSYPSLSCSVQVTASHY